MTEISTTTTISQLLTKLYSSKIASDFHQYLDDEEYDSECLKDDLQDEMPFFVEHIIFTNPSIFNTETQKNELLTNVKQLLNNIDENLLHKDETNIWINNPTSIAECNIKQIVEILNTQYIWENLSKLASYKHKIIEYTQEHKYDGNTLNEIKRKGFIIQMAQHLGNNKLKGQLGLLYRLLMDFDFKHVNDKTYTLQNSCTTEAKLDTSSGSDNDIEELYINNTSNTNIKTIANDSDLKNNQPAKPVKPKKTNGPFKILRNIHNKRAWFNAKNLAKDYESIDSNIIPSLSLKDLNNNSFRKQYEYENRSNSTHWLIPNIILVGEYPTRFVQLLIEDNFTTFVSLDEWKHDDYIDEMKKCSKNMGSIELIAFTIQDFRIVDDKTTAKFVAMLTQKILNIKSGNKIYLHCYGGHGRTGLISSLLLQAIYGMNSEISVKFINEIHKVRHLHCGTDRMPESHNQREQIKRLHYTMIRIYNHYRK